MSSTLQQKQCPMCSFVCPSIALLLSHLRLVHSSDPRFLVCCGINSCTVTSKSFSSLYSHVYRHHPSECIRHRSHNSFPTVRNESESRLEDNTQFQFLSDSVITSADIDRLTGVDTELQKHSAALLVLKLKEQRRVSQIAVDDIVEYTKAQFDRTVTILLAEVRSHLAERGVHPGKLDLETALCKFTHPFSELDTKYKQDRYFSEKLGLIEPEEKKIGEPYFTRKFTGSKSRSVERYDTYHYVPILSTIEGLLSDNSVIEQLENFPSRIRNDGIIEDFCDAATYKNHPLFSQDPNALQIIAYYDELEVCNPLGSHIKKHKVGVVFYTLGNIHPKFRSTYRAINLAILATKPILEKHGIDAVLKPFFDDCNKLSTIGVTVCVKGVNRVFKGALLTFLADNLASNEIGGFKLNFSFSFRCCRTCLVVHEDMSKEFNSDGVILREFSSHTNQCAQLEGPTAAHYSKTYGINRRSDLLDVLHFPFFNGGLPHDCMHDILEGVGSTEVKLLLKHCIEQSYFTLEDYKRSLVHFNYGYTESDRPVPIIHRHFQSDKAIRSSASQMFLLLRILPFLIGSMVPDSDCNWKCFVLLRKIIEIVFCPVVTNPMADSLKILIIEHHRAFVSLYPSSFIPKMHFLIHYPEQMLLLGPMVRTWTIRHEAKLNFFKQTTGISSFKNITLSLANHHQRLACYEMSTGNLFCSRLECGPTLATPVALTHECEVMQRRIIELIPDVCMDTVVSRPNWVCRDGVMYKNNNAYVVIGHDGLDPVFASIDELIVIGGDMVLFNVRYSNVRYFDDHYHAYVVDHTSQQSVITTLVDRNVYHAHIMSNGLRYITLKHSFMYLS